VTAGQNLSRYKQNYSSLPKRNHYMENQDHFISDKPVKTAEDDKFQRYRFAQRLAKTIQSRNSTDSLVIGILGAWGEGKTSVLNFIETELSGEDRINCLRFNPWRYQNEEVLLKNFFIHIAEAVGFTIEQPQERVGRWLKRYGSLSKTIKIDLSKETSISLDFSELGKALTDIDIETFKKRVSEQLSAGGSKLIVFIDDIDRLDKEEIYDVFKMVKLTADFVNTTYILSFDDELVASAINDRYGQKEGKAGALFLEKIVQVPLHLPAVQPFALQQFCFDLMEKAFQMNSISLNKAETDRFGQQFTTNLLPRLTNPRLAVRYNNAISFALPLLAGEANMVDLLLLEGIKVFYAPYYDFIRNNQRYLVETVSIKFYAPRNTDKRAKETKAALSAIMPDLLDAERELIHELLIDLFPILKSSFHDMQFSSAPYAETWYRQQRICSPQYFERYFSYNVYTGQISDIEFNEFINQTDTLSVTQITELMGLIVADSSGKRFMEKLRFIEKKLLWSRSRKIIAAICAVPDLFINDEDKTSLSFTSAFDQAVNFICQSLQRQAKKSDVFEFAHQLIRQTSSVSFAHKIYDHLNLDPEPEYRLFSEDQNNSLIQTIIDKAVTATEPLSIFEALPQDRYALAAAWKHADPEALLTYTDRFIGDSKAQLAHFIKLFIERLSYVGQPETVFTNLTKANYSFIQLITDTEQLYARIQTYYTPAELDPSLTYWIETAAQPKVFTEVNMIRQFIYRHLEKKDHGEQPNTILLV
jgi:predicted KAP-like P-loop ATPase